MTDKVNLNSDDYFRFNSPFRQWLFNSKSKQLSDFNTVDARKLFTNEFVPLWNGSKLPREFYIQGPSMKTNFIKKELKLSTASKSYKSKSKSDLYGFSKQEESRLFSHTVPKQTDSSLSSSFKPGQIPFDKSYQKRRAEDYDELVPKKEGHAKIIEDRRIKSAYSRNERNPLDIEISDDQLLSGSVSSKKSSSDDYNVLLRLERERKTRKEHEIQSKKDDRQRELQVKVDKHNQREKEVQELLKKMIHSKK